MKDPHVCPYLNFDGNCREAMEFYQSCLNGKLVIQSFGDAKMGDESTKDRTVHAMLENGDIMFMASDTMPGMPYTQGNGVHLSIVGTDEPRLRGYFEKLSAGGTVTMPMEKQFWGDLFGTCTDKFGMHWMVNITENKGGQAFS